MFLSVIIDEIMINEILSHRNREKKKYYLNGNQDDMKENKNQLHI